MKLTSDAASKRLKRLQDDYDTLIQEQNASCQVVIPLDDYRKRTERGEVFKDSFDFLKAQKELRELQQEIEGLKHAINIFNAITVLPKHGITIDAALVRMAFLTKTKKILRDMRSLPDVARSTGGFMRTESADVQVCAFDQEEAKLAYRETCDELCSLQQELNYVNVTVEFEYSK